MENGIPNGDDQLPDQLFTESPMESTTVDDETLKPLELNLVEAVEEELQEKTTPDNVQEVGEEENVNDEEEEEDEEKLPLSINVELQLNNLNPNQEDQNGLPVADADERPTEQEEDEGEEGEQEEEENYQPQTTTTDVNSNPLIIPEDELKSVDDQSNQDDISQEKDSDNPCSKVTTESSSSSSPFTAPMPLPSDPIARANLMRLEGNKMKEHVKKAIKAVSEYNKLINQERKDERRFSLDLQTYTFHYPIGLGIENKMLQRNVEAGRCGRSTKYPVAVLPGHYQDWYRQYTSDELKYMPVNTVMYGPVISDPDMLPPVLSRFEEDSFSDSDVESELSSDHSCCCDENRCKKLKLDHQNGAEATKATRKCDCNVESSSSSSEEEEEDDDKPPPLPILMKAYTDSNGGMCYS